MISLDPRVKLLSELLPYDPALRIKELDKGLGEYKLLLTAMNEACKAIQGGNLEQFDALVGENACQIRAVKVALLYRKYLTSTKERGREVECKILSLQKLDKPKSGRCLKDILEREDLSVSLTSDEVFLVESFLLSVAKKLLPAKAEAPLCRNDAADPEELVKLSGSEVTKTFATKLISSIRKSLSKSSVNFVREQANALGDPLLKRMSSEEFTIIPNQWLSSVPMFWTYKTLMFSAQFNGIPLIFYARFIAKGNEQSVIREEYLFLKATLVNGTATYEEAIPMSSDDPKAAIVIQGVVCNYERALPSNSQWKKAMMAQKLNAIFAGAADHRQFPDQREDKRVEGVSDPDYLRCRNLAKSDGFALDNPTTFFIQHVYPSTVKKAFPAKLVESICLTTSTTSKESGARSEMSTNELLNSLDRVV